MKSKFLLSILLAGALAACGDDDPSPLDPGGEEPEDSTELPPPNSLVTLPLLGRGQVTARYTGEVAVRGNVAYTSTWSQRIEPGNTVYVWNVSGSTPQLLDTLRIPEATTTGDVQISPDGQLLVVATERSDGSIVLFDLANPQLPVRIGRFATPNTYPGVHTVKLGVVNNRLYAFLSVDPGQNPQGQFLAARLVIADITNPQAPSEVFVRAMGSPFIHDVFVRDGLLFTALWNEGATIWDIGGAGRGGSPASPVEIGNVRTVGGSAHNLWWYHAANGEKRYLFVGEEGPASLFTSASGDIHVVDMSDMTNPREVAFYSVPGAGTHNFTMDEERGILYAAYYNGGVRALDVTGDLGSCAASEKSTDGRCDLAKMGRLIGRSSGIGNVFVWGVALQGNRLFASDMPSGLLVFDVSVLH